MRRALPRALAPMPVSDANWFADVVNPVRMREAALQMAMESLGQTSADRSGVTYYLSRRQEKGRSARAVKFTSDVTATACGDTASMSV